MERWKVYSEGWPYLSESQNGSEPQTETEYPKAQTMRQNMY